MSSERSILLPLTKLIHENLSVILNFAFSRSPLEKLMSERFKGEWKYLYKTIDEISDARAVRACLELATMMRVLDDRERIADYQRRLKSPSFGRVHKDGSPDEDLHLRDLTNKILHAQSITWDFSDPEMPLVICLPHQSERWSRAEINIVQLAAFCGQPIH